MTAKIGEPPSRSKRVRQSAASAPFRFPASILDRSLSFASAIRSFRKNAKETLRALSFTGTEKISRPPDLRRVPDHKAKAAIFFLSNRPTATATSEPSYHCLH